jgi:hypothetical protein
VSPALSVLWGSSMSFKKPLMDANERELVLKEEVFDVVGCAMEVLNELGHGLLEKPYENALVVEFALKQIPVQQRPRYEVMTANTRVHAFRFASVRVHSRFRRRLS